MGLLICGLALWGCQTESRSEERSPGEVTFRARCMTCHRLPDPQRMTDSQWSDWLDHHRAKAGLDDAELEQILAYLSRPTER